MKIAIFHDYFDTIGGGEKLVLEMAKALNADIYTASLDKEKIKKITNQKIHLLKQTTKIPVLKAIHTSQIFKKANIKKEYDFFILSGNWTVFAAKKHTPNTYYMHTPVRMFYDSKKTFYKLTPWALKPIFLLWTYIHEKAIQKNMKYVQNIIANSKNVQNRIKKYHKRNSTIIYPPIKKYKHKKHKNYWLSVNRITPHKRIHIQVDAFKKLPYEELYVIGANSEKDISNKYYKKLKKEATPNIHFLGHIKEEEIEKYYSNCKGFITTSKDEDFGMTVLEAMSAGKPVIATNEGGYRETVIEGTGIKIKPESKKLIKAIKKINQNPTKYKKPCQTQAKKFETKIFHKKIKEHIKK